MLKTGLKLHATLKERNHHHSPSNSAGLEASFGVKLDLSEEDTNPSWIGPNSQRCVDLANKVYDTCCRLILHSVPQNVDWTLELVDSVLENHRLLRDIPLAHVWRSTAESHHHRRLVSRARSRVQRAARLPWGCAPHGFATTGKEWARVVVESISKKCNLATYTFPRHPDKKASQNGATSRPSTPTPSFTVRWRQLKASCKLGSQEMPRITHNTGEKSWYQIAAGVPWSEENYIMESRQQKRPSCQHVPGLPTL